MSSFVRAEVLNQQGYVLKKYPCKVKLNQNEYPLDLPPKLKKQLLKKLSKLAFNRYPEYEPFELKQKLAKKLKLKAEQLLITNGSNVLVQAILLACSVGEKVMVCDPTFSVYELEANLLGNQVIKFALNPESFDLDVDAFIAQAKKNQPKIIFICNPNAPTGNLLSREKLKTIIESVDALVVIDEAYGEFSQVTVMDWVKRYQNLIVLRTFSKAYGLGGIRLGYLVASENLTSQISKVTLPYCVSSLAQVIGDFLLQHDKMIKKRVKEICAERNKLYQALIKMPSLKIFSSATNFILFQVEAAELVFEKLVKQGVLIRNVSSASLKNALRVSIGTPKENKIFLKAMGRVVISVQA